MNNDYLIRKATLEDVDFIAETIIQAEKSGTDNCGMARLFNIEEYDLRCYLKSILEEEVDGCELSISSFLVAENNHKCVAAIAGWKEGENEDSKPSSILKSNLICYHFPKERVLFAQQNQDGIKDLQIDREIDTYQIEYVYVEPDFRGKHLSEILLDRHQQKAGCKKMYVQVYAKNIVAIRIYERFGFKIAKRFVSISNITKKILPDNTKYLMIKNI